MTGDQLLYIIIGIVLVDYIFDQSLDFINLKYAKSELPLKLNKLYKEEEYSKSQDYLKTRSRFSFITSAFSLSISLIVLLFGGFGLIQSMIETYISNEIFVALAFFGFIFIVSDILNFPFQLYSTFVIEEKFGFNKTTAKTFFTDKLKGYLLGTVVGGLIGFVLLWLIFELKEEFWWVAFIVIAAFTLFMNVFYASLFLPIFNKLKPLEDGSLKDKINAYADLVKFPLDSIFVIDGSKRSTKANAFFSGIGKKKKIVLYDTLIQNHSEEELVAVLAHEVGHFKKKHIVQSLVISFVQMALMLFVLSLLIFNLELSLALGADSVSVPINLIAFGLLYTPISKVTGILMNLLSRKNEYEADAYASITYNTKPLQSALKKLSVDSLSNLAPHPAYVFVHYSHPTLLQRLNAMDDLSN